MHSKTLSSITLFRVLPGLRASITINLSTASEKWISLGFFASFLALVNVGLIGQDYISLYSLRNKNVDPTISYLYT